MDTITKTDLELPLLSRGKVRDIYSLGDNLLIISTDRISAFDVVFNEGIPYKGIILNKVSEFWFEKLKNIINNHYLSSTLPEDLPDYLNGRTMIVKKAEPIKLECVVRGYLTGSGWKSYSKTGKVSGIELPEGLKNGSMLPKPIFTPTTKAESGHDMQLTHEEAEQLVGKEVFEFLKQKSIELYNLAHEYALSRGLVLADTKFEFGYIGNTSVENILLIDEALTPDSSRYWLKEDYDNGNLTSLDKQFLRDYLETLDWNKMPPPPKLPGDVINNTSRRYKQLYKMITSKDI